MYQPEVVSAVTPVSSRFRFLRMFAEGRTGTIEDYERLKEEEMVENYDEFMKMWQQDEYPDETNWYHLVTVEHDDYRAMFLGRELIYQSRILEVHLSYEYNAEELFVCMQDAVKKCIASMREETYN